MLSFTEKCRVEMYILILGGHCWPVGGSVFSHFRRRVKLITQILALGVTDGVLGKVVGTDARLNSVVELLDVPSGRKMGRLPNLCPST